MVDAKSGDPPQQARARAAVANAGLELVRVRDVIPRASLAPLFSLFACRLGSPAEPVPDEPLVVRDEAGELTKAMQQVRRGFGFAG